MWNQDNYDDLFYERDKWNRFDYGMPPRSSADWGWAQHILASLNDAGRAAIVLDTGAEQIVLSRDVASRRRVAPITYMPAAGVGDSGLRGLQVGRIDTLELGDLRVENVPCLIKNPPLIGLPSREPESFSPLALGLSMRVDYVRRELTMAAVLPPATYATELPLRLYRLATVRGSVNGQPVTFVVDTGGEVISISRSTAGMFALPSGSRRIALKVYGTSGWDKDAFLLPNVDLDFNSIHFSKIPVVVLNLKAPSALQVMVAMFVAEHPTPQPPQLIVVVRDVSQPFVCLLPSQSPKPALQPPLQTPTEQVGVAMFCDEHIRPQPPQLVTSLPETSVSQPSDCLLPLQSE